MENKHRPKTTSSIPWPAVAVLDVQPMSSRCHSQVRGLLAGCTLLLTGCSDSSLPTNRDVMSQVELALSATPTPSTSSTVADYLPCTPYQEVERLKFLAVAMKAPNRARAVVEIVYRYTVSSIDMKNDLAAGRRAVHYGRVSCADRDSKEWLSAHYFDRGDRFIVDGYFDFEKTNGGWQLR